MPTAAWRSRGCATAEVVEKLFADFGPRFKTRPGGYTRILRMMPRPGDSAPMALMQLVEGAPPAVQEKPAPRRRQSLAAREGEEPRRAKRSRRRAPRAPGRRQPHPRSRSPQRRRRSARAGRKPSADQAAGPARRARPQHGSCPGEEPVMSLASEFKEFAMRGSVIDLAVGVVIGAAFGKIVNSLVGDVVMPALAPLLGSVNFSDLAVQDLDGRGRQAGAAQVRLVPADDLRVHRHRAIASSSSSRASTG